MRRCASHGAFCVWTCGIGFSDFRRFEAMEKTIRPVGRARGPELTLTRHLSNSPSVLTYEHWRVPEVQSAFRSRPVRAAIHLNPRYALRNMQHPVSYTHLTLPTICSV
eukprot:1114476-Alexandrium_andersonii.AAC.1